jgi:hypothetical protein
VLALSGATLTWSAARSQTFTLADPSSPISVAFNGQTARMTITTLSTGTVWRNPDSGGGQSMTVTSVSQPDATHLVASVTSSTGYPLTLSLELVPSSGDLIVTIGGDPLLSIPETIQYPYALYPSDGSGFAVIPVFGGFVIPTTLTTWSVPSQHSRLEWFGGVDTAMNEGWMMIAETDADMELTVSTGTISGQPRRGGVFKWDGSNANASGASNRLSYTRRAVLRCFDSGGYVAQAKHFRDHARSRGWLVTLSEKATATSGVDRIIGAPVLYLWGDGRSQTMLDALSSAGIDRALVQISVNHVDHNNAFPNQASANGPGWADAVRAKGYVPGVYDIYARYSAQQPTPPFNGFHYLWPTIANPQWLYRLADGSLDPSDSVNNSLAAAFARDTRLPAHNATFGFDAYFSDVVCAVMPREDYDTTYGHFQTRAQDIAGRQAVLGAVSQDHNRLAGVEQLKSWGVPFVHWGEGVFWLGGNPPVGAWDNPAYPQIMTDVMDPTTPQLSSLLSVGFRVPLFDLVYHDCVLATVHWRRPHNKHLYAWDLADQFALIRGQAPLLNLVYDGAPGSVGGTIAGATDARDGVFWDMRWTNPAARDRVIQTFQTVCAWHRLIGEWEMTDHRVLASDFSVQLSEFSPDGGQSGRGIVVNFGNYDGAFGMAGPTWNGMVRGQSLAAAAGGYTTYEWTAVPPSCPGDADADGVVNFADVTSVLASWGGSGPPGDADGNNVVDFADITAVLANFGTTCS